MALANEFFVKSYENNFSKPIELIGQTEDNLFWTYKSDDGELVLIKTDINFNLLLVRSFGNTELISFSVIHKVIECSNGDLLMDVGYRTSSSWKLFLIRIDNSGNFIWTRRYDISITARQNNLFDLSNGTYVLLANKILFIIDENGNIVNSLSLNTNKLFSKSIFIYNQHIYVYSLGEGVLSSRSGLFGLAKFDFNLNFVEYIEYQLDDFYTSVSTGLFEGKLVGDSFICFRRMSNSTNLNKNILFKIPLNTTFPSVITAKLFGNDSIKSLSISDTNLYFHAIASNNPIYKFDENFNFSDSVQLSGYSFDLNAISDFLLFNGSDFSSNFPGRLIIKTDESFESNNCITFNSYSQPTLVEEDIILDNTINFPFVTNSIAILSSSIGLNTNGPLDFFPQLCPVVYDKSTSTIEANPETIDADGISTSTITVQLKDASGNNITSGGETIVISTTKGSIGTTVDNGDGTYTAILTSSSVAETAVLSFTINGDLAINTATVAFEIPVPAIIQSPHLYLQAAGSTGVDGSASGIHLRWLLKKNLLMHLPKGNLANSVVNYNKPNDFVTIYRAPYVSANIVLDLSQAPQAVENRNALWLYQVDGQTLYLYFRDKTKYATVRNTINPLTQTAQFIQSYGSAILELEIKSDLFFAIKFNTNTAITSAKAESEILSVEENKAASEKRITLRKTFSGSTLSNTRLITENGRSLRLKTTNCYLTSIDIEIYSKLSIAIEEGSGWTSLGEFSLSTTDTEVFNRLEPTTDIVNGEWPRFNEEAFVNSDNYKAKWNVPDPNTLSSIKQTVTDYVNLSDAENNPTAVETFNFSDSLPDGVENQEDDSFELSNLMLLQQASMDFHIARMLGLGHLDLDTEVQNNTPFVYMAVYKTAVTLENGAFTAEETEHRYITVPTTKSDEKLPEPVNLKEPVPGVFLSNNIGSDTQTPLTDSEGYTLNGKSRFITLYTEEPEDFSIDNGFYASNIEFNIVETTSPVFAGIEYKRQGETNWKRPELPNTEDYKNIVPSGQVATNETVPLPIPEEGAPLFVHQERESAIHVYSSYGINWFSRVTYSSVEQSIETIIQPNNQLLPPSDRSALLITEEPALVLTSANEQQLLAAITTEDKTLIRLLYNYNTEQELISYKVTPRSLNGATDPLDSNAIFSDDQEIFADEIEIYFRDTLPLNINGKALNVTEHPTNEILAIISTGSYNLDSTGETILPSLPPSQLSNFIGGVFVLEEKEYIIHEVVEAVDGPIFTVYKKQISDRLQSENEPNINEGLVSPKIIADGMFLAVENMQNTSSWGTPNPLPLKVTIGDNWEIHREIITRTNPDGELEEILEKTRGIWDNATVEKVLQPKTVTYDPITGDPTIVDTEHRGQYKATFNTEELANHPQDSGENPVQWYKGIIRLHTTNAPNGERRNLEVFKIENIGTNNALVVHFVDNGFSIDPEFDEIIIGNNISTNFYPGYRVYQYSDATSGITQDNILPSLGEGVKYTCFGFRSLQIANAYFSRIAVPTVMFAQEVLEPKVPELPIGALYTTWPDSFGKATYTLTTQFTHAPHGILYYRVDDDAILNALYTAETVANIKEDIANSDLSFLANRWQNLLSFNYDYPSNSFQEDGTFGMYPEDASGYRLPNPDSPILFDINNGEVPGSLIPGDIADRIEIVVMQVFVPLTEVPLLYQYINEGDYQPIAKKQIVRNSNGSLLAPTDVDFDIAPMAKKVGVNKVQFTDFTLDGTSDNIYFYTIREVGNTMQIGDSSPILGPIKLVNTNPPIQPAIRSVLPVLENPILGILPQMQVNVNAYPKLENIKRLSLYRAFNATDALSIRTMQLVKVISLEDSNVLSENIWTINDAFEDLIEVPFGDPLYYRVTVSREVEYPDKDDNAIIVTEYVPSIPSKLVLTTIVENINPISPELSFTSDEVNVDYELHNVILSWNKTAYNSKYYLYKLNEQGQWVKIYETTSNDDIISVSLENTDSSSNILSIENSLNDNQSIFHHFKVIIENTAGLLSQEEHIITIPSTNDYNGIGGMDIEETFIIR